MRMVRCPACRTPVAWEASPYRPFCSERCRLVDLDAWVRERHRIPGEPVPDTPPGSDEDG